MIECNKNETNNPFGRRTDKKFRYWVVKLEKNDIISIAVGVICVLVLCGNLTILQIYKNCYLYFKVVGK